MDCYLVGNVDVCVGQVTEIQQAGATGFVPVPEGTFMMYEHGGPLLRDT
jgi:hypothetical protein